MKYTNLSNHLADFLSYDNYGYTSTDWSILHQKKQATSYDYFKTKFSNYKSLL